MSVTAPYPPLDPVDRRIVAATQAGLPLTAKPYHAVADALGLDPQEVMSRFRRMLDHGIVRRLGAVPNHYRLGFAANGMTVWDVADDQAAAAGRDVGKLDFVSHCYLRPRHLPQWPYNLFAMVHGRNRDEVEDMVRRIAGILGDRTRRHEVLYSTRILKKTGFRLAS